jgi:hypothetical protein
MNNDFLPPRGQNTNRSPRPAHHTANWERPVAFRTPEEVATEELAQQITTGTGAPVPKPKKSFKQRLKELTKKQWAIIIAVGVILLGLIGFAVYHFFLKNDPKPVSSHTAKQETPTPGAQPLTATLTGLPITDASINKRPVTAVMIENSPDARPQAGLNQAGVVFEAVAEGGITRFLTLFQDTEPDYIGPVRSVRPYYVQWLEGFDAAVAHVGGSGDALAMLKRGEAKDLDQFYNPGPYHRVSNRYAPHNMYSSIPALRALQEKKGYTSSYTGFARKAEAKGTTPTATSIDFNISGALYNPHYDYDATTNSYKRSEGGKPHIDEKSGQIAPKVVVALTMPQGLNGIYTTYGSLGSGEVHIFQDGIVTTGTWSKPTAKDQITFKDASGAPIKLDPGQTWISVVGSSSRISYK